MEFCNWFLNTIIGNESFQASIVGILITILAIFAAFIQITFSVSEIPRRILQQYTFKTWQTLLVFVLNLILTGVAGLFAIFKLSWSINYILFIILTLSIVSFTMYFLWFIKRLDPETIFQQISESLGSRVTELRRLEDEKLKDSFLKFQKFLEEHPDRYELEFIGPEVYRNAISESIESKTDKLIGRIDVEKIDKLLTPFLAHSNFIKVLFEVEPAVYLPNKLADYTFGFTPNRRLLSLVFQEASDEEKRKFLTSINHQSNTTDLDSTIRQFFRKKLDELGENTFEDLKQEVEEIKQNIKVNVDMLDEILAHALRREEGFQPILSILKNMLNKHLFAAGTDVYLNLKHWVFMEILTIYTRNSKIAFQKGVEGYYNEIITMFYQVLIDKALPAKNGRLYSEIMGALSNLFFLHLKTATARDSSFVPKFSNLVLNISEWIRWGFFEQFEKEAQQSMLRSFYEPVMKAAIRTCGNIFRAELEYFGKEVSTVRIKRMERYRDDLPKLFDYFSISELDYKLENDPEFPATDLAKAKAKLALKSLKELQNLVFVVSAFITFKVERLELPVELVWKVAMPMANAYGLSKQSYWEEWVREAIKGIPAYQWPSRDYDHWFWISTLHEGGRTWFETFGIMKFWVLLDIYRKYNGFGELPNVDGNPYIRKEDAKRIFPDEKHKEFWAEAQNISPVRFAEILDSFPS